MKKTINIITTAFLTIFTVGTFASAFLATPAFAAGDACGVETAYLDAICADNSGGSTGSAGGDDISNSGLWKVLTGVLNLMLAGVGILAVGGIVYGAILYSSAQDNQGQVEKAIEVFRNVVIGLISYALMYSLLTFLIPGGVF